MYLAYNGQVTGIDFVPTEEFLLSEEGQGCQSIRGKPAAWATAGFKPATVCVNTLDDVVRISLRGFGW